MKLFAAVFVTYISLLTVSPGLCELFATLQKVELCCSSTNDDCSSAQTDDTKNADTSDTSAPNSSCCSVQNCQCYFVNVLPFDFSVPIITTIKKISLKNDNVSSTYLSDCWHPPKVV